MNGSLIVIQRTCLQHSWLSRAAPNERQSRHNLRRSRDFALGVSPASSHLQQMLTQKLRAAELTAGNLCVGFPEIRTLFSKQAQDLHRPTGPTPSILQGSTHGHNAAKTSIVHETIAGKLEAVGHYIELRDGRHQYGVDIAPVHLSVTAREIDTDAVYVEREVRVESRPVTASDFYGS